MKANKDFRMNKETKRLLALGKYRSNDERAAFRRAMIDAQLTSEKAKRDAQRGKVKDGE